MQATTYAPHCPVCGHTDYRVLKQNSPTTEFLPADLIVSRTSKRQCNECKTTFFPERQRNGR